MEAVMTTGAISRSKLQSNHHHQQTNTQFFYRPDALPVAQPSVTALKVKISHSTYLLTPSSPGGLPTLFLTTNSSWLPWRRVDMPLISPLMPVPQLTESGLVTLYDIQPGNGAGLFLQVSKYDYL